MTDNVLYGIDFSAKRARDELRALSQAMAPDAVFIGWDLASGPDVTVYPGHINTPEMSIEERVRRSIYHGAGLPYPKDSA